MFLVAGLIMYKPYSDSTLLNMNKKELIEQLRVAEHNCFAAEESLNQQAENMRTKLQLIKHGYWIKGHVTMRCSKCFASFTLRNAGELRWDYCPACGARMDKKE